MPISFTITVSVHYTDKLKIVLKHNLNLLDKWIFVVDPNDEPTLNVLDMYKSSNIIVLKYDHFWIENAFDKDGGLRFAQEYVQTRCKDHDLILLLDSDILLPTNFLKCIENTSFENDSIYTAQFRNDFKTREAYEQSTGSVPFDVSCWGGFWGYFQLYTNIHKKYTSVGANGDGPFRDLFQNRVYIKDLSVIHLGVNEVNWNGRKSESWDTDITAISVSVNHSHYLNHVMPQNLQFFQKWYILTDITDEYTKTLVQSYDSSKIELLTFDFGTVSNNDAIRSCQEQLMDYDGLVLVIDRDIYLPDNFKDIISNMYFAPNVLFTVENKIDYETYEDILSSANTVPSNTDCSLGTFQLYKNNKNKYDQYDKCNETFREQFIKLEYIDHLTVCGTVRNT